MERYVPGTGFIGAGSMTSSRYQHHGIDGDRRRRPQGPVRRDLRLEIYWQPERRALHAVDCCRPDEPGATRRQQRHRVPGLYAGWNGRRGWSRPGCRWSPVICQTGCRTTRSIARSQEVRQGRVSFTAAFTTSDGGGHANTQTLTIHIDRVSITTAFLPNPALGVPYNAAMVATGLSPFTWSLWSGTLPPGLSLVGNAVTGTPTAHGFYVFTIRALDVVGQSGIGTCQSMFRDPR